MEASRKGWTKEEMVRRVIEFFRPGDYINLGIGLPTLIADAVPPELDIFIQSENGVLGVAGLPTRETVSATLINAGKETISVRKGAS